MALAKTATDVTFPVPARAEAIAAARRRLRDEGLDPDLEHTVSLLTSELLTNAIRHAGLTEIDRVVVAARLAPDWARVEVRDEGPGFDPEIRHGAKGYGLRMLDALASDWGVDRNDRGTRVWFEVDRRRRRFDRNGDGRA